jgi:transcriptional regulator with XRE-family HTH domain
MANAYRSAAEIARDLRSWMKSRSETQTAVAARIGVTQPQLSRILAGNFSPRRSRKAQELCNLARIPIEGPDGSAPVREDLCNAVLQLWDGTLEDADRLQALLHAARRLREPKAHP